MAAIAKSRFRVYLKNTLLFAIPWLILLLGVYLWLAYPLLRYPPKLTRNFTAELNARIPDGPEHELAWPRYREAIAAFKPTMRPAVFEWEQPTEYTPVEEDGHPDSERWPLMASFLRENSAVLEALRAASRLPHLGYRLHDRHSADDWEFVRRNSGVQEPPEPASRNPSLRDLFYLAAIELKHIAMYLRADMHLAAVEGDRERLVADFDTILRMCEHNYETGAYLSDLIASQMSEQASHTLFDVARWPEVEIERQALTQLQERIQSFRSEYPQLRAESEYWGMLDLVQRIYTDDGKGNGVLYLSAVRSETTYYEPDLVVRLKAPLVYGHMPDRREALDECDAWYNTAQSVLDQPLWEAEHLFIAELESQFEHSDFAAYFGLQFSGMLASRERVAQTLDAALAVVAILRFRGDRGVWPTSLDKLKPKYLTELPVDRFTGEPLRYVLIDSHPRLYSVGFNRMDDGGLVDVIPEHYPEFGPHPITHNIMTLPLPHSANCCKNSSQIRRR